MSKVGRALHGVVRARVILTNIEDWNAAIEVRKDHGNRSFHEPGVADRDRCGCGGCRLRGATLTPPKPGRPVRPLTSCKSFRRSHRKAAIRARKKRSFSPVTERYGFHPPSTQYRVARSHFEKTLFSTSYMAQSLHVFIYIVIFIGRRKSKCRSIV